MLDGGNRKKMRTIFYVPLPYLKGKKVLLNNHALAGGLRH